MYVVISLLYPISIYLIFKYLGLKLDDVVILKFLPLFASFYVTVLIGLSFFNHNSFILKFAQRFSKEELSDDEVEYIKNSTLFWLAISLFNMALHIVFLVQTSDYYWIAYASFGWYGIFVLGGLLQYFHRKFFFLRRVKNV